MSLGGDARRVRTSRAVSFCADVVVTAVAMPRRGVVASCSSRDRSGAPRSVLTIRTTAGRTAAGRMADMRESTKGCGRNMRASIVGGNELQHQLELHTRDQDFGPAFEASPDKSRYVCNLPLAKAGATLYLIYSGSTKYTAGFITPFASGQITLGRIPR